MNIVLGVVWNEEEEQGGMGMWSVRKQLRRKVFSKEREGNL